MRNINIFYANEMQLPKTQNRHTKVQTILLTKGL